MGGEGGLNGSHGGQCLIEEGGGEEATGGTKFLASRRGTIVTGGGWRLARDEGVASSPANEARDPITRWQVAATIETPRGRGRPGVRSHTTAGVRSFPQEPEITGLGGGRKESSLQFV